MKATLRMKTAWGDDAPDWVRALAKECDLTSQVDVSRRIVYSTGAINSVLGKKYNANPKAIEQAIRGALMNCTVMCPVAGEITSTRCIELQRRRFAATNPQRVKLYKACRNGCQHYKGGQS